MKVGIIGSYGHVNVVLNGLRAMEDVQFCGLAKWGPDDPVKLPGNWRREEVTVFEDYRAILDQCRPDVVAVFTPLYLLAGVSIQAAQRGIHVVSEKPLATELDDLERLREAVGKTQVRLGALMNHRSEGTFQAIRAAVAQGRIGRAICAAAQKSYPFAQRDAFYARRETYGGTIPWQVIHAIDYIRHCTGQDFTRVAAFAGNSAHPSHGGMEDQGGLIAQLSGGGTAVINFDYLRPWGQEGRHWGDDRLRLAGTEGIIETKDCARAAELLLPDRVETLELPPERNFFTDFVRSLQGQGEPPITTEDSFRITEIALKARQAQDEGRVIDL